MPATAEINIPDFSSTFTPDAHDLRDDLLDGLTPTGLVETIFFDFMVRQAAEIRRMQIVETIELTETAESIRRKHCADSEPLDPRMLHALALGAAFRDKKHFASALTRQGSARRGFQRDLRLMRVSADTERR